jgi:hypothetical protein
MDMEEILHLLGNRNAVLSEDAAAALAKLASAQSFVPDLKRLFMYADDERLGPDDLKEYLGIIEKLNQGNQFLKKNGLRSKWLELVAATLLFGASFPGAVAAVMEHPRPLQGAQPPPKARDFARRGDRFVAACGRWMKKPTLQEELSLKTSAFRFLQNTSDYELRLPAGQETECPRDKLLRAIENVAKNHEQPKTIVSNEKIVKVLVVNFVKHFDAAAETARGAAEMWMREAEIDAGGASADQLRKMIMIIPAVAELRKLAAAAE